MKRELTKFVQAEATNYQNKLGKEQEAWMVFLSLKPKHEH